MYKRYEKFLKDFDEVIDLLFELQKEFLCCKKGCSLCCRKGDYPISQLEFGYLTQGFMSLPGITKILVQQNIRKLKADKKEYTGKNRFEHVCPFLINEECSVYQYRGIVCRTFGICYYNEKEGRLKLPGCVNYGLNYSKNYNKKEQALDTDKILKVNLKIDRVLNSELAKKYQLDSGEIRPLLEWFEQK